MLRMMYSFFSDLSQIVWFLDNIQNPSLIGYKDNSDKDRAYASDAQRLCILGYSRIFKYELNSIGVLTWLIPLIRTIPLLSRDLTHIKYVCISANFTDNIWLSILVFVLWILIRPKPMWTVNLPLRASFESLSSLIATIAQMLDWFWHTMCMV